MPALLETHAKRAFYRQTFEVKDKGVSVYKHTLLVNPQDMSIAEPARINAQQTLGGAYVAHFGQGLHQISINGLTGYNARHNAEGKMMDGYTEIQEFRNKIYRDFLTKPSSQLELFWYNWEDEEYYKVVPTSFRLMRNKAEPLLYRYELQMIALEPVGAGTKPKMNSNAMDKIDLPGLGSAIMGAISGMSEALTAIMKGGR